MKLEHPIAKGLIMELFTDNPTVLLEDEILSKMFCKNPNGSIRFVDLRLPHSFGNEIYETYLQNYKMHMLDKMVRVAHRIK